MASQGKHCGIWQSPWHVYVKAPDRVESKQVRGRVTYGTLLVVVEYLNVQEFRGEVFAKVVLSHCPCWVPQLGHGPEQLG